ncbi:pseudouridine synthase [Rothia nasimurium]|uniref:pseudouridine synthase n=1 Tax=Rothia nasimurium TaxID=85336 RepID=UPI001F00591A|nr:pseudouridine synthase [Rothia nasimurium]
MRRINRHLAPKPLPQRKGIDAVSFVLPDAGNPEDDTLGASTVLDYLVARFYPHERSLFTSRFERDEVKDADGQAVAPDAPLTGQKIWYYRELGVEKPVPFDMPVLYEDEWVLAIDKPHFLPTTPNGSFVAHTALTQLRVRENNPDLIPIHRLDRATAGVVLFAKTPEARAPFQTMFQRREPTKTYEAVAAPIAGLEVGQSLTVRSRIDNQHGALQVAHTGVELLPGDTGSLPVETKAERRERRRSGASFEGLNAQSRITCLRVFEVADGALPAVSEANPALPLPQAGTPLAHYLLEPHTGKTHQLRVHLAAAGAPIMGDVVYPTVLPIAEDEPALPLQLLARSLAFPHPFTGDVLTVRSGRRLRLVEQVPATGEVRPLL